MTRDIPQRLRETAHSCRENVPTWFVVLSLSLMLITPTAAITTAQSGSDGQTYVLYAGNGEGEVHAVYSNGTSKWVNSIGSGNIDDIATSTDQSTLYVALTNDIHILNASNGAQSNTISPGNDGSYHSVSATDDHLYVGSGNTIYKVNRSDNSIVWSSDIGSAVEDITVDSDGSTVYFGSGAGGLYSYTSGGTENWQQSFPDPVLTVSVGPDDTVVYAGNSPDTVGADDAGTFGEYDASDGSEIWNETLNQVDTITVGPEGDNLYTGGRGNEYIGYEIPSRSQSWLINSNIYDSELSRDDPTEVVAGDRSGRIVIIQTEDGSRDFIADIGSDAFAVSTGYESAGIADGGVRGTVKDGSGNAIENATITVESGGSTIATQQTGPNGGYNIRLDNGTYSVTASADGYFNSTENVTVSGDVETLNFELLELSEALQLDTRDYLKHGQTAAYTVTFSTDGGNNREDVTGDAEVTSNNTSVVTVNTLDREIVATSDTSVNRRTYIQANYTHEGETYVTRQNVTVANSTVENLAILPPMWRVNATFSSSTIQAILVAIFAGIFGARVSTSFGGLALMQLMMVAGWFTGYATIGVTMISLFTALFIGLNMAANIDYMVGR